jgi:hypothetical protein
LRVILRAGLDPEWSKLKIEKLHSAVSDEAITSGIHLRTHDLR